jgi:hypothetical protein
VLIVKGDRSHLFYVGSVQNHDSGVYFHTTFQESGWPNKGHEVQVNNTHSDPKKTAGLYGVKGQLPGASKRW